MAKAAKKRDFKLYRNEITLQPDTEIGGIDTMDNDKAKKHLEATKYVNIDKGLNPAVFYELTGILKGDSFKNVSKRFSVSQFHGVTIETLADCGFMEGKRADLMRGIVATGIISLCIKGGVSRVAVNNTLSKVAEMTERENENKDHLELLLSKLDLSNAKCRGFLRRSVAKFGNNQYGLIVLFHISSKTNRQQEEIKYKKTTSQLTKAGSERCEVIAKEPLTDKMYVVDDKDDLASLDINMSERYWGLVKDYKRNYYSNGTIRQVLRAATVTGLFCLSKWLLRGKISKDEANFYALYHDIEGYARTHY